MVPREAAGPKFNDAGGLLGIVLARCRSCLGFRRSTILLFRLWRSGFLLPELIRSGLLQRASDHVQVDLEQVGVAVQHHRRGCVPEHPLDHLGVCASTDGKPRRRVPEVVAFPAGAGRLNGTCQKGWIWCAYCSPRDFDYFSERPICQPTMSRARRDVIGTAGLAMPTIWSQKSC